MGLSHVRHITSINLHSSQMIKDFYCCFYRWEPKTQEGYETSPWSQVVKNETSLTGSEASAFPTLYWGPFVWTIELYGASVWIHSLVLLSCQLFVKYQVYAGCYTRPCECHRHEIESLLSSVLHSNGYLVDAHKRYSDCISLLELPYQKAEWVA